ncbi:unnamed protein product [Kuraishia capsulata CBS 1993]|uniref:CMP/dCMP-type deaminase domain-containing protein n=1 Tax=Kuraishia capsulata CBS 1993 TaxID=1382522 RepID=W6MIV8_9ASCO|nr:uncharacterized protein KUCA_T00002406001 [Kuraishia capsulata CBS 1993]CDK26434.1 unnamed protein product [Kuraishia capsulata CBS 1993]
MFPQRNPKPSTEEAHRCLRLAIEVAHQAKLKGRHPFGCVLVGPSGEVLLEQGNIDTLNHAESTICRTAWKKYETSFLWRCTLYTNFEPCCMCAGSCYWANVGRVVYGLEESALLELTGDDSENMTMNMPSRKVFDSGQKAIEVLGPYEELRAEILEDHRSFWKQ